MSKFIINLKSCRNISLLIINFVQQFSLIYNNSAVHMKKLFLSFLLVIISIGCSQNHTRKINDIIQAINLGEGIEKEISLINPIERAGCADPFTSTSINPNFFKKSN